MLLSLSSPGRFQIQKLWALVIQKFHPGGSNVESNGLLSNRFRHRKIKKYTSDHLKQQCNLNTTAFSRLQDSKKS